MKGSGRCSVQSRPAPQCDNIARGLGCERVWAVYKPHVGPEAPQTLSNINTIRGEIVTDGRAAMQAGIDVGNYTTSARRELLASEIAKPAHGYEGPKEGVLRLTAALLVGISRDLEALTAKVDAIMEQVPDCGGVWRATEAWKAGEEKRIEKAMPARPYCASCGRILEIV